jgi:hypothetical protein
MRVYAGSLGRHVGANAHHPTSQLIGQFERLQFQVVACTGKEGFEIFNQRRNNQLVAPALAGIHNIPAQGLDPPGQRRQNVLYPVRQ